MVSFTFICICVNVKCFRCKSKNEEFLEGRPLYCEVNQQAVHVSNVKCCWDQDLCNDKDSPTLAPPPSKVVDSRGKEAGKFELCWCCLVA